MPKVATIILNRNLPIPTDNLYDQIIKHDAEHTDVFILESGSDQALLSKNYTWHANSPEAMKNGLRYCRGMNYSLLKLKNENKFDNYDFFLLITNDTEFQDKPFISKLIDIMIEHPRVGLLSPCSSKWGEKDLLLDNETRYFWYIHNNAYFIRKEFIEDICEKKEPDIMNFFFDGNNFRGYASESEIIAKGYANDWASAITKSVWAEENESYLINQSETIKTDKFEKNIQLYLEEGLYWMKSKYGFNSRWQMQMYVKLFYNQFFKYFPEYEKYRL